MNIYVPTFHLKIMEDGGATSSASDALVYFYFQHPVEPQTLAST